MRRIWGVLIGATCFAGAVCAVVPGTQAAQPPPAAGEAGPKEVGIRGQVTRGAAEGACAIKVSFGKKKVITYEVAPESPRASELPPLIGKTVEATGLMKKGPHGENLFVVMGVSQAVAQQ